MNQYKHRYKSNIITEALGNTTIYKSSNNLLDYGNIENWNNGLSSR